MKFKTYFILLLSFGLVIQSCIKDEPLYEEADIDVFSLPYEVMVTSVVSDTAILIMVNDTTDIQKQAFAPHIEISPKAAIFPAIGDSIYFKDYKFRYTVTSESGRNIKTYSIEVVPFIPLKFDFDEWTLKAYNSNKSYPVMASTLWDNANPGVAMVVPNSLLSIRRGLRKIVIMVHMPLISRLRRESAFWPVC